MDYSEKINEVFSNISDLIDEYTSFCEKIDGIFEDSSNLQKEACEKGISDLTLVVDPDEAKEKVARHCWEKLNAIVCPYVYEEAIDDIMKYSFHGRLKFTEDNVVRIIRNIF